jgi:hypothetical protein
MHISQGILSLQEGQWSKIKRPLAADSLVEVHSSVLYWRIKPMYQGRLCTVAVQAC